tara:strand:+ start:63 stop:830 length:768 start_codon:yes stop_codon:yes gene_type:complete
MVNSNLMGGLGNYLFQIASSLSLALDNRDTLIYDDSDVTVVHKPIETYKDNIFRNINFSKINYTVVHYNEPNFHFDKIKYVPNIRLNGYFQSEKYFNHQRDKILEFFSPTTAIREKIKSKYPFIGKSNVCSIHVRRGDYLRLPYHHPVCSSMYYGEAINHMGGDNIFLVFSDDIEWCKTTFKGSSFIFVENNTDFEDLYLMSMCDNNIIANSSFSWWGAWLNDNKNKKVVAPSVWFGPAIKNNTKDLIPENWIKL